MSRDLQYYKEKLNTLRSAMDDLLAEMDAEPAAAQPRKRRNLKEGRVMKYGTGTWRKPAELKKSKRA